jgi:hypothetical protein
MAESSQVRRPKRRTEVAKTTKTSAGCWFTGSSASGICHLSLPLWLLLGALLLLPLARAGPASSSSLSASSSSSSVLDNGVMGELGIVDSPRNIF